MFEVPQDNEWCAIFGKAAEEVAVLVRGGWRELERGVGGDGVCLLDSRLAVPQSSEHFKIHIDREGWVAQVGRGAAPGRLNVVSFPVGCQEMRFLGFLEGLPQRDSLCLHSQGPDVNYE